MRFVGRTKVCLNYTGHITKMATMSIYGKTPLKIFFFKTSKPMAIELGIQHRALHSLFK